MALLIHKKLLKLNTTHSKIHEEFGNRYFLLQKHCPDIPLPVDLTLEHMINNDAGTQWTEISAIMNFISTNQRLNKSHFMKLRIMSLIFLKRWKLTKKRMCLKIYNEVE